MEKTIFVGLVVGIFATIAMATTGAISSAVYADKGGDPNNKGPSQENANERHLDKILDLFDDNPNNDNGKTQSHLNMHDGNGVE